MVWYSMLIEIPVKSQVKHCLKLHGGLNTLSCKKFYDPPPPLPPPTQNFAYFTYTKEIPVCIFSLHLKPHWMNILCTFICLCEETFLQKSNSTFSTWISLTYQINFILYNPRNFHLSFFRGQDKNWKVAASTSALYSPTSPPLWYHYPPPSPIYHLYPDKVISTPLCFIPLCCAPL